MLRAATPTHTHTHILTHVGVLLGSCHLTTPCEACPNARRVVSTKNKHHSPLSLSIAYNKLNIFSSAITANKRINNAGSSSGATNENIMLTKWQRKAARKWFAIKLIADWQEGWGRKGD